MPRVRPRGQRPCRRAVLELFRAENRYGLPRARVDHGLGSRVSKPPVPQPPLNTVTANHEFLRFGKTSLTCLSWPDGKMVVVWADIDGFTNGTSGPSLQGVRYSRTHGEIVKRQKTVREGEPRPPEPPKPPGPPVDPNALTVITTQEETGRAIVWQCDTPDGVNGSMVAFYEKCPNRTSARSSPSAIPSVLGESSK
jgi:hypothetical protein